MYITTMKAENVRTKKMWAMINLNFSYHRTLCLRTRTCVYWLLAMKCFHQHYFRGLHKSKSKTLAHGKGSLALTKQLRRDSQSVIILTSKIKVKWTMNSKLFLYFLCLCCSTGDCSHNCLFRAFLRNCSWLSKKLNNSFLNKSPKQYKLVLGLFNYVRLQPLVLSGPFTQFILVAPVPLGFHPEGKVM